MDEFVLDLKNLKFENFEFLRHLKTEVKSYQKI
jgi:hypothetical protein